MFKVARMYVCYQAMRYCAFARDYFEQRMNHCGFDLWKIYKCRVNANRAKETFDMYYDELNRLYDGIKSR